MKLSTTRTRAGKATPSRATSKIVDQNHISAALATRSMSIVRSALLDLLDKCIRSSPANNGRALSAQTLFESISESHEADIEDVMETAWLLELDVNLRFDKSKPAPDQETMQAYKAAREQAVPERTAQHRAWMADEPKEVEMVMAAQTAIQKALTTIASGTQTPKIDFNGDIRILHEQHYLILDAMTGAGGQFLSNMSNNAAIANQLLWVEGVLMAFPSMYNEYVDAATACGLKINDSYVQNNPEAIVG